MTTMLITRVFKFSASHRYYDDAWSPEKNWEVFGPCSYPNGHGHNYLLEVSIKGHVDPQTGMIINLKDLKAVVDQEVIKRYDHRHLNLDVDDFAGTQPTTEQVAVAIWTRLVDKMPIGDLARIRLWENDELYSEVSA
jgi:6-pyruvoyltetrahydropterin/6-carboxytetrahydropterin synthase